MSNEPPDFRATLQRFVADYRGAGERAILRAGDVFEFYSRLFTDARLSRSHRTLVNAVLAYFVVPDDLLPEEDLGPYGLLDDLFVAAHVHRLLRRSVEPAVLADAWVADAPLEEVMAEVHAACRGALGRRTREVLRMAGLA
ncbi:MAG: DUF1232 domain-containing protein [Nannocystaceae bacterium]|nr:DUF1232 domain-containing protein [Myxococcales bacterium]